MAGIWEGFASKKGYGIVIAEVAETEEVHMAEARLIPQTMAELLRLSLNLDATYTHPNDLELEPVTDFLPESFRELVLDSLSEYHPIMVYTAPRKQKSDPLHLLVAGQKGEQWYALTFGLPSGDYATCMALLREAADKRRQPWNYWEVGKRGWTIASGVVGGASVAVAGYLLNRLGASSDVLQLVFAELALGTGIGVLLVYLPKLNWEQRGRKIEDLLDAIPA